MYPRVKQAESKGYLPLLLVPAEVEKKKGVGSGSFPFAFGVLRELGR